jgi:hypothetical protein
LINKALVMKEKLNQGGLSWLFFPLSAHGLLPEEQEAPMLLPRQNRYKANG